MVLGSQSTQFRGEVTEILSEQRHILKLKGTEVMLRLAYYLNISVEDALTHWKTLKLVNRSSDEGQSANERLTL